MTDVQATTETEHNAEEPGRPGTGSPRRLVLLGAGAVGATAVLAACGTSTSSTNTSGTDYSNDPAPAGSGKADAQGGSSGGDGGGSSGGTVLAAKADVPEGGGIIKNGYVITQPTAGTFKAFGTVCPHQQCNVSKVADGSIICPCHGSKFDVKTGDRTAGPATKGLPVVSVEVKGDNIVKA